MSAPVTMTTLQARGVTPAPGCTTLKAIENTMTVTP